MASWNSFCVLAGRLGLVFAVGSSAGCGPGSSDESGGSGTSESGAQEGLEIIAGSSVGPIALESSFGEALTHFGDPDLVFVSDAIGFARYDELGLELVFTSPEVSAATDDGVIIAIGVKKAGGYHGALMVGQARSVVEESFGDPADQVGDIAYFAEGISAMFDDEGRVEEIGVFAPFQNVPQPPEMVAAPNGGMP
jgi:hypothetical protein